MPHKVIRKIIFLFFFIFLMQSILAGNIVDYVESFDTVSPIQWDMDSLDNVTIKDLTSSITFNGGIGTWYLGHWGDNAVKNDLDRFGGVNDYIGTNSFELRQNNLDNATGVKTAFNSVIWVNLDEKFSVNEETVITVVLNKTLNCAANIGIVLINETNDESLIAAQSTPAFQTWCSDSECGVSTDESLVQTNENYVFTYLNSIAYNNSRVPVDINRFAIIPDISDSNCEDFYIKSVTFENVLNGTNSLPHVNMTTNTTNFCILQNETSLELDLNLFITDDENDTLYFSQDFVNNFNHTIQIEFKSHEQCLDINTFYYDFGEVFCIQEKDLAFVKNVDYRNDTTCRVNEGRFYNNFLMSIVPFEYSSSTDLLINEDGLALEFHGACNKDQEFFYLLDVPKSDIKYETTIYGLDDDENITFNFMQYDLTTEYDVEVVGNNTDLIVVISNSTGIMNTSIIYGTQYDPFYLYVYKLNSTLNVRVRVFGTTYNLGSYNVPRNRVISYFNLNYTNLDVNEKISMSAFRYTGLWNAPVFTTVRPTNLTVYENKPYVYAIYISDFVNYVDEKYNYYQLTAYGDDYCERYERVPNTFDQTNFNFWNYLKLGQDSTVEFMKLDLSAYGIENLNEVGKKALVLVFIIGLFGLIIGQFAMTGRANIMYPVLMMSSVCLFVAVVFDYKGQQLMYLLFIAMSFAPYLLVGIQGRGGFRG